MTKQTQLPLLETTIDADELERNPPKERRNIQFSEPFKQNTSRKYADIKKRYAELKDMRVDGMGFKYEDIVSKIAYEFYMDEFSIRRVLLRKD